jgi:hypothetical protein
MWNANANTNGDAIGNAYTDGDAYSDGHVDSHTYSFAFSDSYAHSNVNAHGHALSVAYLYPGLIQSVDRVCGHRRDAHRPAKSDTG